jgi:hypothetical protein
MADSKRDREGIEEALETFQEWQEALSPMQTDGLADARFALLGEQWPQEIADQRQREGRPTLTMNHMPKYIRQVTNDARQNKPQVKIRPVDGGADVKIAEVYGGLIRQIESASDADIAYDTAAFCAVTQGVGFWRVDIDYACDDSWDYDICVNRIPNPLAVTFDPLSKAGDASDWRGCFVVEEMEKKEFEELYPGADTAGWKDSPWQESWFSGDMVRRAEYWQRKEIERKIWLMSDGQVIDEDTLKREDVRAQLDAAGITAGRSKKVPSYKIIHKIMSGAETLEETEWAGTLIPIVPVFGEEFWIEGRRYWRSLIHHGKDAQRNFNYWRSAGTELVALAPKAPFIGPKGFIGTGTQAEKWGSANAESHSFLEYDGQVPPERSPFAGVPSGVLQEAQLAAEDMREIIGINLSGFGVQEQGGPESGRALRMRRSEGDTGTFHFHDNLSRAVRYSGRVMVELIPKVYNTERVLRILGDDGTQNMVPVNQPIVINGQEMTFDLTVGKYDVAVDVGPSFTTRREEAVESMTSFIQAYPPAAPILADMIAKASDWPDSAKVAKRMESMLPPAIRAADAGQPAPPPEPPPEVQAEMAKAQASMQIAQQKAQQDFMLEQQKAENRAKIEQQQAMADIEVERQKAIAQMEMERQKANLSFELAREKAQLDIDLELLKARHTMATTPQKPPRKGVTL